MIVRRPDAVELKEEKEATEEVYIDASERFELVRVRVRSVEGVRGVIGGCSEMELRCVVIVSLVVGVSG